PKRQRFLKCDESTLAPNLTHFRKIHEKTGIPYSEMGHGQLFFDDEYRNKETEQLGVTFCLVRNGMDNQTFEKGLAEWRKRHPEEVNEDVPSEIEGDFHRPDTSSVVPSVEIKGFEWTWNIRLSATARSSSFTTHERRTMGNVFVEKMLADLETGELQSRTRAPAKIRLQPQIIIDRGTGTIKWFTLVYSSSQNFDA
ncbi:hypothetical protein MPER_11279, partial [Moniliophthora perniciosa FA553]